MPNRNSPKPTMTPRKETSPELSSLAAKYLNITPGELMNPRDDEEICRVLRKLSASVLSQDEHRG